MEGASQREAIYQIVLLIMACIFGIIIIIIIGPDSCLPAFLLPISIISSSSLTATGFQTVACHL